MDEVQGICDEVGFSCLGSLPNGSLIGFLIIKEAFSFQLAGGRPLVDHIEPDAEFILKQECYFTGIEAQQEKPSVLKLHSVRKINSEAKLMPKLATVPQRKKVASRSC